MAVALRGYTQGTYDSSGGQTIAWPSGTAAGDLAVVYAATRKGRKPTIKLPSGWQSARSNSSAEAVWWKFLTSADIAAALPLNAAVALLQVLSGVVSVGASSAQKSITVTTSGGALFTAGRKEKGAALTPPDGRIHASDVVNDGWSKRRYNTWLTVPSTAGHVAIASNADAAISLELMATAPALTVPAPLSPANGTTVATGTYSLAWTPPAATWSWAMREVQLRAVGSGTWGTVKAGTWYPSTSANTESSESAIATLAGGLTADTTYEWRVRLGSPAGTTWSDWSAIWTFTPTAPPTVTGVSMTAVLEPVVSWTKTGTQSAYRLQVWRDLATDVLVYDSGVVASNAASATVPVQDWVSGGAYYAAVTIWSSGSIVSASAASSSVTISWTPPAAPSSATFAQGTPPTLTVAGVPAAATRVRVQSFDGVAWSDVATLARTGTSMVVPLPLAPYGVARTYRAAAEGTVSGVAMWSAWVTSASGTSTDPGTYLVADDGSAYLAVHIASDDGVASTEGVSISRPLGASRPVVIRTPSQGVTGRTTLACRTSAERAALVAWIEARERWWLRWPPELEAGAFVDAGATLMAPAAAWAQDRFAQAQVAARLLPIPWVQQ
jgi:hypothetical protein